MIVADPACPSLVAVSTPVPGACPVATPAGVTATVPASELDQETTRAASATPRQSWGVADSCTAPPTTMVWSPWSTVTDATGAKTVRCAVPLLCSAVAVTITGPWPTPVTRPVDDTVARKGSELVQWTARPLRG